MRKLERIVIVFGICALVAAVVFVIAGGTVLLGARGKVKAEIEAIKKRGEPVSAGDLAGPKIPDSENGAAVYEQIFKRTAEIEKSGNREALRALIRADSPSPDPKAVVLARKLVAANRWVTPMVAEAVARPKCRFRADWEHPFRVYPYTRKMTALAALLGAAAVLDADAGKTQEALHKVELTFRMSDAFDHEPGIVGQLVRADITGKASNTLLAVSRRGRIGEANARRLYDVIGRLDWSRSTATAIAGERVQAISLYDAIRERGTSVLDPSAKGRSRRPPYPVAVWFYNDELWYLQHLARVTRAAPLPYRKLVQDGTLSKLRPNPPGYFIISNVLSATWNGFLRRRDETLARLAGSRGLLALQIYRYQVGAYPDSLAQMSSATGLAVPQDPFTGRDMVYKKVGPGFLMYSIGSDLVDNGGRAMKRNPPPAARPPRLTPQQIRKEIEKYKKPDDGTVPSEKQYDIVWKLHH